MTTNEERTRKCLPSFLRFALLAAFTHFTCVLAQVPQVPAVQSSSVQPAASAQNLTLAAATSAAFAQNPALIAARMQLLQVQARADQADALTHSQVSFTSSVGIASADVIQPPPSSETFGTFTNAIAVPLPLGKKTRLTATQAQLQLQAAQATFDSARLLLRAQVSSAFYTLLQKSALVSIARDTSANADRQLADARKRFAAGDVPELDVLRAQVPVAAAAASLIQAENEVIVAKQALNSLAGYPLDAQISIEPVVDALPSEVGPKISLADARAKAVLNSPDVRSAEAAELAADTGVKIAGLAHEPTYALQLSDTRSNDQTSFSRLDSVQAVVSIPLFDGGLARAQQRESTAAREQAHAQTENARRTALLTVSANYLNVQTSVRQVSAALTAAQIAQTTYDKTQTGYTAGLFPLTDVLNAQSALTQARVALAQATYDAAVARAALDNSLGILP